MINEEHLNNPEENQEQETPEQEEFSRQLKEMAENAENKKETPPQKPARLIDRVLGIEKHRKRQEAVANEIKELREKEQADWDRQQENSKTEKEIQEAAANLQKVSLRTPEEITSDSDSLSNLVWEKKGYTDLNITPEKTTSLKTEYNPPSEETQQALDYAGKRIEQAEQIEKDIFGTSEQFEEVLKSALNKKDSKDNSIPLTEEEKLALDLQDKFRQIVKDRGKKLRDLNQEKVIKSKKRLKKI